MKKLKFVMSNKVSAKKLTAAAVFSVLLCLAPFLPLKTGIGIIQLVLCLVVLFCAKGVFADGFCRIIKLCPNENSLAAVGAAAAFLYSVYGLFNAGSDLYFPIAACLLVFALLGGLLRAKYGSDDKGKKHFIYIASVTVFAAVVYYAAVFATGDFYYAAGMFSAVLVAACPIAAAYANKIAAAHGVKRAKKHGIVFNNAKSLETLGKTSVIVFEKEGTLSVGKPVVTDVVYTGVTEEEMISDAAAVARFLNHPLTEAILSLAMHKNLTPGEAGDIRYGTGFEITGTVNGKVIKIGGKEYTGAAEGKMSEKLAADGKSVVFVTCDGKDMGIFGITDAIKPESISAVSELEKMGLRVIMLTEQNAAAARKSADKLGIESVYCQVLRGTEADYIKKIKGMVPCVAAVGSNIAALANADVGISTSDGTDITLTDSSVYDAVNAVKAGRSAAKSAKRNTVLSFVLNIAGAIAAPFIFDVFGSLGVVSEAVIIQLVSFAVIRLSK